MKARRRASQPARSQKDETSPSPLVRKALAVTRQQQKEAVTAAMEESQRKAASGK